jgi:hypothetical protein
LIGLPPELPRAVSVMPRMRAAFSASRMEQLVEVAHAVEHQHGRVVGLDAQVLLHHRRDFFGESGMSEWSMEPEFSVARRNRPDITPAEATVGTGLTPE